MPPRVYVGYSIYKGKAALTVEPRPPEFAPLDVYFLNADNALNILRMVLINSWNKGFSCLCFCLYVAFMEQSGAFKISKEGFVLLQFAPAAGVRQYDWTRKQVKCSFILLVKIGFLS